MTIYSDSPWSFPATVPQFGGTVIASDPDVLLDGSTWRMYYTDLIGGTDTQIAKATSSDGVVWTAGGIVIPAGAGDEQASESACIFKTGPTGYLLPYCTYDPASPGPIPHAPSKMRIATSSDGISFTKAGLIIDNTPNWYDADLIFSPTVVAYQGAYSMLYVGHSYQSGAPVDGVRILGATSSTGLTWTKYPTFVLQYDTALSWMAEGAAEPSLILGPDGNYYMFFTGLGAGDTRSIGIAVASAPFGPYTVKVDPIITNAIVGLSAGDVVIAPSAVLAAGTLNLWYTQVTGGGSSYKIAYAQSDWSAPPPRRSPVTWFPYNQYVRATDDLALRITDNVNSFRIPVFPTPWVPLDVDTSFVRFTEDSETRLTEDGQDRLVEGDLWLTFLSYRTIHDPPD